MERDAKMETKDLLKRIEEIIYEKLQSKRGWGRNEIAIIYQASVNETLIETTSFSMRIPTKTFFNS